MVSSAGNLLAFHLCSPAHRGSSFRSVGWDFFTVLVPACLKMTSSHRHRPVSQPLVENSNHITDLWTAIVTPSRKHLDVVAALIPNAA